MATILVADDDQLLRAIIRDHLERADHTVLEAGDGMAAMDIALEERPEVLLLDVMMPLARGLEVVRRVRQQEGWHPAIIMISARTRVTDRLNALEAGADAYIEKPFAPADLLATIERQLDEGTPARFVDVLGPIWASVALERLAEDAVLRRTGDPVDREQVASVFSKLITTSLGQVPGVPGGTPTPAMRLVWEDAIRGLLTDTTEPQVPTVTDVPAPDAIAAVERLIGNETLARHRTRIGPVNGLDGFWAGVLDQTLCPADLRTEALRSAAPGHAWTARLRDVLAGEEVPNEQVARWTGVLGGLLAADAPGLQTIDPLEHVWLALSSAPRTRQAR